MSNTDADMIRTAIRDTMQQRGLTQAELAARAGVPQPKISRLLAGSNISLSNLERLLAALDIRVVGPPRRRP